MRPIAAFCLGIALCAAGLSADATCGPSFFALSVADLDASVSWYQEKLGLTVTHLPGNESVRVALLQGEMVIVELIERTDAVPFEEVLPEAKGRYLVHGLFKAGFFVGDLNSTVSRLRESGARFRGQVFDDPVLSVRSILVLDNSDNILQLFERISREDRASEGR